MKAEKWKYLYDFSNPTRVRIRLFFYEIGIIVSFALVACILFEGAAYASIVPALFATLFITKYFQLKGYAKRIIEQLSSQSAEMLDFQTLRPYIVYKRGNQQGLFYADDYSAKNSFNILNPLYSEIDYQNKVFLLQRDGKWGVYNPTLGKIVIPCEFYYLKFSDDRLYISGVKGYYKYRFSLSGTELNKEINDSSRIDEIIDKL